LQKHGFGIDSMGSTKQIDSMKNSIFFLMVCLIGLPLSAWSMNQVEHIQSVYEQEKERITSTFRSERLNLPQRYITALRNLEQEAALEGDQNRERAIREVRQQFTLSPLAENLRASQGGDALENLRQQYQDEFENASQTREEDLAVLQEQYRAALSRLQEQLQRDGQDDALQRVERSLSALPAARESEPDDDLLIDLGDDEPVASTRREPAERAARTTPRAPAPSTPRAPAPRRDRDADEPDPFDALMDAWLE